MMDQSELHDVLKYVEGVFEIREFMFKKTDEQNYYAMGSFEFTSNQESGSYTVNYATFRRPNVFTIGFTINFIYERFKCKVDDALSLKLVNDYNRIALGIKVNTLPQGSDDEFNISFKTEFYINAENVDLIDRKEQVHVSLRFLENAPLAFSNFLKKQFIEHDYLSDDNNTER
ncbi:hypothetical protein [Lelliottia nimipressuralis]